MNIAPQDLFGWMWPILSEDPLRRLSAMTCQVHRAIAHGYLSHATAARDSAKSPEMYRCGMARSTRTKWLYRDWPFCMYCRLRSARSYRPTLTAMPLLFGRDGDA